MRASASLVHSTPSSWTISTTVGAEPRRPSAGSPKSSTAGARSQSGRAPAIPGRTAVERSHRRPTSLSRRGQLRCTHRADTPASDRSEDASGARIQAPRCAAQCPHPGARNPLGQQPVQARASRRAHAPRRDGDRSRIQRVVDRWVVVRSRVRSVSAVARNAERLVRRCPGHDPFEAGN
jgi:hypothetical protein